MSRQKQIEEKVRALGFDSLEAFLTSRPGVGDVTFAKELGPPIVGVDLVREFLTRAHARGQIAFREAALDLLARHLREGLPNGWNRLGPADDADTDVEMVNIAAFTIWSSQIALVDETVHESALSVFDALKTTVQTGWRPEDHSDPLLRAAFNRGWPAA